MPDSDQSNRFQSLITFFRSSETVNGLLLAVAVGLVAGLGAVIFRWLIQSFQTLFFNGGGVVFGFLGGYYVILIPAIGGLLVGPLVYYFAREAKGHGVPVVMEAVALKGGRIRPRVSVVTILASSICIGSGGSVGREGPIVQIGSTFGSTIGQWLRLPDETVKMLVACGAAGGIAATFNAPIGGVFFAMEIVLGRVVTRRFGYVVLSAVVADFIAQVFLGNVRTFTLPSFGIISGWEFAFYIVLGILAGLVAQAFTRLLYWCEDRFDSMKFPEPLQAALGGLAVGAIGLYSHDLFGVGYDGITRALSGDLALTMLLAMLALKIVATSVTLSSGGSGGIFAPSLFMGAMLGTAVGLVFDNFFPGITAPAGAYGTVGMAAVFSAAARAPFSAIMIIFEITGNYAIILPLMTAVVISTIVSRAMRRESIYTLKLARQGVDLEQEEMGDVLRGTTLREVMTRDYPTLPASTTLPRLVKIFQKTGHHGFPVMDEKGRLIGVLTETDFARYLDASPGQNNVTAGDIVPKNPFVAYPDQTLDRLLEAIEQTEARIPVVSRENGDLLGVVGRHELITAYRRKAGRRIPPRAPRQRP